MNRAISLAVLILFVLATHVHGRRHPVLSRTPAPKTCNTLTWEKGYPKVTTVKRQDCAFCGATDEVHKDIQWERSVTVESHLGLSLPDILGANADITHTVSKSEGEEHGYTCHKRMGYEFICMVVKYEEVITEGWMIKKKTTRTGPRGKNWSCKSTRTYVKVSAFQNAYPACMEEPTLKCKSIGFAKVA